MDLAIAEGDLRDAAIQDDDLPDDGVDKVLELQVVDMESEAREINAAMPHSVLEQEARCFLSSSAFRFAWRACEAALPRARSSRSA